MWFSGSRLAPDLSLPKILNQLIAAEHFTTGYRPGDPWRDAARALDQLPAVLARADEQQAADRIHAVGTLLDAAAQTAPHASRAELRQAAAAFERATRSSKEADYQAGRALRELAYQLTQTGDSGSGDVVAWLLCTVIAAVVAIARWHNARHHHQQVDATQQTLTHLRPAYGQTAAGPLARITIKAPAPQPSYSGGYETPPPTRSPNAPRQPSPAAEAPPLHPEQLRCHRKHEQRSPIALAAAEILGRDSGSWLMQPPEYLDGVDELTAPTTGMTISVRTRQDVVIVDPERFLASARDAYRELDPDATEESAAQNVHDVHDAVFVLLERFGRLVADTPLSLVGLPGQRELGRSDGLSPAGELRQVVLNDPQPLQDYGCFLPEDPFALPSDAPKPL
ncbi:hypothetical protein [Streptacidiphilus sp. PAMC 29251]